MSIRKDIDKSYAKYKKYSKDQLILLLAHVDCDSNETYNSDDRSMCNAVVNEDFLNKKKGKK